MDLHKFSIVTHTYIHCPGARMKMNFLICSTKFHTKYSSPRAHDLFHYLRPQIFHSIFNQSSCSLAVFRSKRAFIVCWLFRWNNEHFHLKKKKKKNLASFAEIPWNAGHRASITRKHGVFLPFFIFTLRPIALSAERIMCGTWGHMHTRSHVINRISGVATSTASTHCHYTTPQFLYSFFN